MAECSFCHKPAKFQLVRALGKAWNVIYLCVNCNNAFSYGQLVEDEVTEAIPKEE